MSHKAADTVKLASFVISVSWLVYADSSVDDSVSLAVVEPVAWTYQTDRTGA